MILVFECLEALELGTFITKIYSVVVSCIKTKLADFELEILFDNLSA